MCQISKIWLVLASIFFYGLWNPGHIVLILFSILLNYGVATALRRSEKFRKPILLAGVFSNILLLGYYKYANFIVANINRCTAWDIHLDKIVLPLAISFFTFQQIAFLVDTYRGEAVHRSLLGHCLFISFFPQLIAGPIVHHSELMPQFDDPAQRRVHDENIAMGIFLFSMGLFKKTVIADTLAVFADQGFDQAASLDFFAAWVSSLAYTFQLYFDFSGYTDMALGSAQMLNIRLPINFNAPYKALSIQDFWRRWHITLSRFLHKYLYIPLGGNRGGDAATYRNLFLTFLIGGIWHGAGWTFVAWGALHGIGMVAHRIWRNANISLPAWLSWLMTFMFVNFCWIFFRADSFHNAFKVIRGMADVRSLSLDGFFRFTSDQAGFLAEYGIHSPIPGIGLGYNTLTLAWIVVCCVVVLFFQSSNQISTGHRPSLASAFYSSVLLFFGLMSFLSDIPSKFIYFQF